MSLVWIWCLTADEENGSGVFFKSIVCMDEPLWAAYGCELWVSSVPQEISG